MLDTDPTATVDDLEHDLADLDEAELPLEQHPNGGSATTTDDEARRRSSVALAPPVEEPTRSATSTPSRSTGSAPIRCRLRRCRT